MPSSDTSRFTVRSAPGAGSAVTVNSAAEPSVTFEPPEIVTLAPFVRMRNQGLLPRSPSLTLTQ